MRKNGFSFIELMTVVTIIPILALISVKYFGDQRKNSYRSAVQGSMVELMTLMETAKKNDGAYHQFIYQMGYRPKGSLIANIGVKADNSAPCCTGYPALGAVCSTNILSAVDFQIKKGERCPYGTKNSSGVFQSGQCKDTTCRCEETTAKNYTYYNCGTSSLDRATDVYTICNDSSYSNECSFKRSSSAITSGTSFGSCSTVCNCDEVSLGAISGSFSEKMVLNSKTGSFCID